METRRLQQLKGGSFLISLPKRWITENGLKQGKQLALHEDEKGTLTIYPVTAPTKKTRNIRLNLEDYDNLDTLRYVVLTCYIQGCDEIILYSKQTIPAETKKQIRFLSRELPGVEIGAGEEANSMNFNVLLDPTGFSMKALIRDASVFSLQLHKDAMKSMFDHDIELAKEVIERSTQALRHYRMTIRQTALASTDRLLSMELGVRDCQECVTFALVARDLSRLVYHSKAIAEHVHRVMKDKMKLASEENLMIIGEMSIIAYQMQKLAVRSFLEKDVSLAIAVMRKMKEIRNKDKRLGHGSPDHTLLIAYHLRRIAGYSVAIADDAMNRTLSPLIHHKPCMHT